MAFFYLAPTIEKMADAPLWKKILVGVLFAVLVVAAFQAYRSFTAPPSDPVSAAAPAPTLVPDVVASSAAPADPAAPVPADPAAPVPADPAAPLTWAATSGAPALVANLDAAVSGLSAAYGAGDMQAASSALAELSAFAVSAAAIAPPADPTGADAWTKIRWYSGEMGKLGPSLVSGDATAMEKVTYYASELSKQRSALAPYLAP